MTGGAEVTAERDGGWLGGTALVRLAGVPVRMWEGAGNQALFARAAELAGLRGEQRELAAALSDRLGAEAVPDGRLSTAERRAVLALRRRLFAGDVPAPGSAGLAPTGRLRALHPELAADLAQLAASAAVLRTAQHAFARQVAAERDRVCLLALDLVHSSAVLRSFVDSVSPRLVPDTERRLARGASWTDKPLRKAGAALWRAIGRSAMKTTPRGWTGQLSAVPVEAPYGYAEAAHGQHGAERAGEPLLVGATVGDLAAQAVENVHLLAAGHAALDPAKLSPETPVALTPLLFRTADAAAGTPQLRCAVVDPAAPTTLRHLTLRRTQVLDAVLTVLADGPRTLAETERLLAARTPLGNGGQEAAPRTAVLRGLLGHLLRLGVLQVCGSPRGRLLPWTGPERVRAWRRTPQLVPDSADPAAWYVDSYRTCAATVPAGAVDRVARGVRLAARVHALCEPHAATGTSTAGTRARWDQLPGAALIGESPLPLGDLVSALLPPEESEEGASPSRGRPDGSASHDPSRGQAVGSASRDRAGGPVRHAGWRPAGVPGSGYARLLAHLAAHLDEDHVDLGPGLLDALGAPPAETALPAWPLDCLLRPLCRQDGAGKQPVAVLESVSPAGMVDARFAEALDALYGTYGNVSAYRAFLAAVERESGARFLELLVPPLAARAANAVRRPVTTSWCTGDPNTELYYGRTVVAETARSAPRGALRTGAGAAGPAVRHVPLDRVTLRRSGGSLIAEVDGVRVLPVVHATRTAVPPWDTVQRLLRVAGHPGTGYVFRLDGLAAAFPRAARVPRVTVGGDLVVSPAQWRVPRARMWRPEAPEEAKVIALASLRRAYGLPRFCFARATPEGKPVPVDLESLPAVHLLERLYGGTSDTGPLLEEALPGPHELLLRDGRNGRAADGVRTGAEGRDGQAGKGGSAPTGTEPGTGAGLAAQVLLRMPHDRATGELAARAAAALGGTTDLPGAHAAAARATGVDPTH
ncbi:lantibiotic dehydratase [Streptomyces iconiensis]|uniref:Lantibiotic dehydratase n=1 Tax=Streptomyces iconiensis TaxID=1384038 RepID=A0ABT6ZQ64_9ACTN|nr:lantibiotic dehydratase [Streptomyces iconiensis]MDJ1130944.1 lantibiotic dehydratase [Streptomyces iconiensis]